MALFARAHLLCAAFFAIAPLLCALAQYDLDIPLYINQVASGPGTNQAVVVQGSTNSFGMTAVSDWPILNGPPADPSAKVIGRARGLHTLASPIAESSWFTTMNLMFTDERFNGSTLAVMGTIPLSNEWSIVGGTGVFRMARGFVEYTIQPTSGGRVYKIDVHVVFGDTRRSVPIADN